MKPSMESEAVYTLGYGTRALEEVIRLFTRYGVSYVIDVRSSPYSRFKPEFSQEPLARRLEDCGIRYVFMGDLLGGRPVEPYCYRDGKVDYDRVKETAAFCKGIERVSNAWSQHLQVCLLCSEGRPEECHRSKLIGDVLEDKGIPVRHIALDGALCSQNEVIHRLTGAQQSFFGNEFTSRKRYRPRPTDATSGAEHG